jgi:septal ring factor EnvC (AmiA/AmiB activator)
VNAKLILFTKESRDSLKNMELLENINSILMKKADEIKEKSIELEKVKAETTQKLRDTEHLKRVREGVVKEYNNEKVKLNQLAAVMEQDKESKREYIKLLNTKRSEFENQLTKIRKQIEEAKKQEKAAAADNSVFGKLKGNLNWPIEGTVIEHFGPKKIDGFKGTINNNGLKIKPAKNSDVKVVEEGTVRYIDNIRGFGNIIIIGHAGSYYTLYANMAGVSVQTGEKVKAAQVIGVVSVDLPTDASYLYFEIRKGNQAVNPIDWLKPMRR